MTNMNNIKFILLLFQVIITTRGDIVRTTYSRFEKTCNGI